MKTEPKMQTRENLTMLLKRRSVVALLCGILTLMLAFYGIIEGVNRTITIFNKSGFSSFSYYTMVSNMLAALSMAFVCPYTVEGIRRKRFTTPKWVAVMHYMVTTSIAITMVFVLAFISWASPDDAFGGENIVTHVFCPILIIASFFQMESGHLFTWKDRLLGIIPFSVYAVVYFIEVVIVGEANGGWPDIYRIQEHLSLYIAIPALLLLALSVSIMIALISNFITKKRNKKMFLYLRDDLDPIEVKIEAYGLGRMTAQSGERNNIQIPYDILTYIAKKYDMKTEDLMKPFIKGLMMEIEYLDKSGN